MQILGRLSLLYYCDGLYTSLGFMLIILNLIYVYMLRDTLNIRTQGSVAATRIEGLRDLILTSPEDSTSSVLLPFQHFLLPNDPLKFDCCCTNCMSIACVSSLPFEANRPA